MYVSIKNRNSLYKCRLKLQIATLSNAKTQRVGTKMLAVFCRRHRTMIIAGFFFFYLGCGITLSSLRMDCKDEATLMNKMKYNYKNNVEYVVLILSSPGNVLKRDAIRTTWAKFASNIFVENGEKLFKWNHTWIGEEVPIDFIKFYYVIGTQGLDETKESDLRKENARSKDLLLFPDFVDSYKNLASKMLLAMKWLSSNLKHLKYVIKCDDDSFVRVDLIIRDLEAYAPRMSGPEIDQYISYKHNLPLYKGLYWGYFDGHARVYTKGKWQESAWFLCDKYLPYALGGGYVISRSIVDYIARNSDFLSLYMSEDVSMGVWTAALDGINRVHDVRFDTEWQSRGCLSHMLVRHKQTPKDMFEMYKTLVQSHGEKLCKTDVRTRNSYYYKWDAMPSLCCK
ncbi:beta-1,3-galactosyltransferase 6 isoform X2 [Plodia interpunctella]|uniref:beta-1,3-galactosyltransferase 6 isoform X2 n=1 Tax=Plodia interpunctella TaxID=58824 RepID=UPI002368C0EC|nr:beta-1,3-galactosyltransferase 6 isoform X2 [Plodia interpunctella]